MSVAAGVADADVGGVVSEAAVAVAAVVSSSVVAVLPASDT